MEGKQRHRVAVRAPNGCCRRRSCGNYYLPPRCCQDTIANATSPRSSYRRPHDVTQLERRIFSTGGYGVFDSETSKETDFDFFPVNTYPSPRGSQAGHILGIHRPQGHLQNRRPWRMVQGCWATSGVDQHPEWLHALLVSNHITTTRNAYAGGETRIHCLMTMAAFRLLDSQPNVHMFV